MSSDEVADLEWQYDVKALLQEIADNTRPKPESEKPAQPEGVSPHGVWRCECCAAIADPIDSAFRWNGECWQHHHAEAQTHYDCRFFGSKPEPAPFAEQRVVITEEEVQAARDACACPDCRQWSDEPAPKVAMTEELTDLLGCVDAIVSLTPGWNIDNETRVLLAHLAKIVRAQAAEQPGNGF